MADNRGVVYMGPGTVEVHDIDFPSFELKAGPGVPKESVGRKCHHGVILRIVSTNICGSDQHMVRGRTTAPEGLILGHEITGEVIEKGRDVEFLDEGDLIVVNTSGTLAAALDALGTDGTALVVHLSQRLPAGLWLVELRRPNGRATDPWFEQ